MTETLVRPPAAEPSPSGGVDAVEPTTALRDVDLDSKRVRPRAIRSRTFDDIACLAGAFAGSLATTYILYEFVLPFDGRLGFFLCWYLLFLGMYLGATALSNPRTVVVDRLASTLVQAGAGLTALALASAVTFPFIRGYHALVHLNFLTSDMGGVGPQDAFNRGGVLHAIVGTLIEIGIALIIALPLGIGAAVYMSEVGGKFARVVRTVVEAMTALPSVVAGLFIYTLLIVDLHIPKTGFTAAMALAVMILPIIARASDVVLRVVPGGLREASLALGASRWQTVWRVVLPTVRPGLATAVILGVARGIGETSPVLLTSGNSSFFNANPFSQPMDSLPLQTYFAVRSGEPMYIERGFATACVLLILVLLLFITARLLARQRVR
ncbi:phosphate ABC transporter permease PstA [uncultured Jatrophihabitans sp.]|uniref:phosphate ABC transporter permease PstA n=1 Tax=uncultured Jatrophihabitans sp. TaxID=1610747 RepID=UPI0035CB155E